MHDSLPPDLRRERLTSEEWNQWVHSRDKEIRKRVDQGEEFTLSNLLCLGTTYTREPRISFALLAHYGHDPQVDSTIRRRAKDLIRALAGPRGDEGMLQMRAVVYSRGLTLDTPAGQDKIYTYLLAAAARQRDEVARVHTLTQLGDFDQFQQRGLSTDSDVYTGYMLQIVFENMLRQGLLKPGGLRRVAIIGPGLDYVNKSTGYDFYPPQTIQPFAVIDALLRLGLADRAHLQVRTFDISRRVNQHLERARTRAASGLAYTEELAIDRQMAVGERFMWEFGAYWQRMGDQIGQPTNPVIVPAALAPVTSIRAIRIRPEVVAMIFPQDLNIVLQNERRAPDERFDLEIGINVFLYYDMLERALAKANLVEMLKPGGLLISNTALPLSNTDLLQEPVRTSIPLGPGQTDLVFSYVRRP